MKVLVTGGGTGGHINPAIAIANTIKAHEPDSEIAFVGTSRGMENKLVPQAGYPLMHVEVRGLRRSLSLENIKVLFMTLKALHDAKKIVKQFRPDLVVGTGGYVCYPICRAAASMGVPVALHESNAVPGVAVKMLASCADRIYLNFESTAQYLNQKDKLLRVGNPLKNEYSVLSKEEARKRLGISEDCLYLVSCGGSLGAARINAEILTLMKEYSAKHPNLIHVHATGAAGYEEFMTAFREQGLERHPNLQPVEYLYDMPLRLSAADLVINRAGAMTLSELAMLGKAAILIPSPNVTDNHQYKNAKAVADADAALLLQESDLLPGTLVGAVSSLLEDPARRAVFSANFRAFAVENASERIYSDLKRLVISRNL